MKSGLLFSNFKTSGVRNSVRSFYSLHNKTEMCLFTEFMLYILFLFIFRYLGRSPKVFGEHNENCVPVYFVDNIVIKNTDDSILIY